MVDSDWAESGGSRRLYPPETRVPVTCQPHFWGTDKILGPRFALDSQGLVCAGTQKSASLCAQRLGLA